MNYWFLPQTPEPLGICRILFYTYLLCTWHYLWRGLPTETLLFWKPTTFFSFFSIGPPRETTMQILIYTCKIAWFFCAIGYKTRISTILSLLVSSYVLGMAQNFGHVGHKTAIVIFTMGIFALSRCGDALSLDSWMTQRSPKPSGEYRWPIRCVWLTLVTVFFVAGLAKLRNGGLEWISSQNLAHILLAEYYAKNSLSPIVLDIAKYPLVVSCIAFFVMVIELAAPLALFPRAAPFILPALFGTQLGIASMMAIHKWSPFFILYGFWIPWDRFSFRLFTQKLRHQQL